METLEEVRKVLLGPLYEHCSLGRKVSQQELLNRISTLKQTKCLSSSCSVDEFARLCSLKSVDVPLMDLQRFVPKCYNKTVKQCLSVKEPIVEDIEQSDDDYDEPEEQDILQVINMIQDVEPTVEYHSKMVEAVVDPLNNVVVSSKVVTTDKLPGKSMETTEASLTGVDKQQLLQAITQPIAKKVTFVDHPLDQQSNHPLDQQSNHPLDQQSNHPLRSRSVNTKNSGDEEEEEEEDDSDSDSEEDVDDSESSEEDPLDTESSGEDVSSDEDSESNEDSELNEDSEASDEEALAEEEDAIDIADATDEDTEVSDDDNEQDVINVNEQDVINVNEPQN